MANPRISDTPHLLEGWDWEVNEVDGLDPRKLTTGSNKEVNWKCPFGHTWVSQVKNRANGNGCPYCAGKKVLVGYTDLATLNPQLSSEWDRDKNVLSPTEVTPKSGKRVFWLCSQKHTWDSTIYDRTKGNGCPFCGG